jgi:PAS domain S-box-containing protein
VVSIFPPDELKRFQYAVDAAINENAPYGVNYRIIRNDGKIRYIHDEGQIIHDNEGNAISMFGTTQDITKRKQVEESLKESEAKFRNFVETSPDMIWEIDTEGIFNYISPQSSVVLGYKPQEIIGNNIVSLISPGSIEMARKSLFAHINGPNKFNTIEVSAKHRNGNEIIIEIRSLKITDKNGQVKGFQGIARDITDKTIATNQLKTSIKEKDILLQEIHHRVKNNMQIISSLLNLQIRHVDDNDAIDLLKESQNRVRSMAMIHEKLYQSNDFTQINITEYIESLVSGLFYSYSISKDQIIPIINVDDVQLNIETAVPCGLIIDELVSNSLKHGFPQEKMGEVYISLKIVDDNYELVVSDNGIKFPKDINFRSTDSLGLQLVNNLVNQIDGSITLDITHGTEFKIIFKELTYKKRI